MAQIAMETSTIKVPAPAPIQHIDRTNDYDESLTPVILSSKVIPISIVNKANGGRRSELDNKNSNTE